MDTNTQNKPTPHPHAELIKAWADGAKIQSCYSEGNLTTGWRDDEKPAWSTEQGCEYRIKPEEPSSEPWKPKEGELYYGICAGGSIGSNTWKGHFLDEQYYEFGNCFRTREEAAAAAGRVKAALKGEVVPVKELEALKTRNENLHKAKEALINKQTELDGKPLTAIEKEAVRKFRAGIPFAEAECGTWRALSPGEDALIRAIRKTVIRGAYREDAMLIYPIGGSIRATSHIISFDTHGGELNDNVIRSAINQIADEQAEQEAKND